MGPTGATGATGASGAQGQRAGIPYQFATSTSVNNPGTGLLRLNSATLSAVTTIAVSDTAYGGFDVDGFLDDIGSSTSTDKGIIVLRSNSNSDLSNLIFKVTSVVDQGTWHQIVGTYLSGSVLFSASEELTLQFFRYGDLGPTGATGATGAPSNVVGPTGPTGPTGATSTASVGTVTTGDPGGSASVTNV